MSGNFIKFKKKKAFEKYSQHWKAGCFCLFAGYEGTLHYFQVCLLEIIKKHFGSIFIYMHIYTYIYMYIYIYIYIYI